MSLIQRTTPSLSMRIDHIFFFNSALALFIAYKILQLSLLAIYVIEGPLALGLKLLICLLLLVSEIIRRDAKHNVFVAIGALTLGLALTFSGATLTIFFTIAIVYEARGVPFVSSAKVALATTVACVIFVIGLSQLGVLNDYIWSDSARTRHGFGFRYCTYISLFYLNCVLLIIYIRSRMTIPLASILMIINCAIYHTTVSRTGFLLVSIALLCALIWSNVRLSEQHRKRICKVGELAVPAAMILSVFAIVLYDLSPGTFTALNQMLSGRLSFTSQSLANYGITPFGQLIKFAAGSLDPSGALQSLDASYDTNVVDNSFWSLLINHGFVLFVVVIGLYMRLGRKVLKNNDFRLGTILAILALHAVIDQGLIALWYNTFLLLFANYDNSINDLNAIWRAGATNEIKEFSYGNLINNREF